MSTSTPASDLAQRLHDFLDGEQATAEAKLEAIQLLRQFLRGGVQDRVSPGAGPPSAAIATVLGDLQLSHGQLAKLTRGCLVPTATGTRVKCPKTGPFAASEREYDAGSAAARAVAALLSWGGPGGADTPLLPRVPGAVEPMHPRMIRYWQKHGPAVPVASDSPPAEGSSPTSTPAALISARSAVDSPASAATDADHDLYNDDAVPPPPPSRKR